MRKMYLVGIKTVKFTRNGGEKETIELLGYTDGSLQLFSSVKKAVDECRSITQNYIDDLWLQLGEFPDRPAIGEWYPTVYTGRYRLYLQVKLGLVE